MASSLQLIFTRPPVIADRAARDLDRTASDLDTPPPILIELPSAENDVSPSRFAMHAFAPWSMALCPRRA
jgi:hypothetical protein